MPRFLISAWWKKVKWHRVRMSYPALPRSVTWLALFAWLVLGRGVTLTHIEDRVKRLLATVEKTQCSWPPQKRVQPNQRQLKHQMTAGQKVSDREGVWSNSFSSGCSGGLGGEVWPSWKYHGTRQGAGSEIWCAKHQSERKESHAVPSGGVVIG